MSWYPGKILEKIFGGRLYAEELTLKWVKDSANIYWTSTKNYIHSLFYDPDFKDYTWYVHSIKKFEELKKEVLYPPIEYEKVIEARNIREAMKHVEETLPPEELEVQHPELVEELVREREKAYRELKKRYRALLS